MFIDRFRQQIEKAEKRFAAHHEQREERLEELKKIDKGLLDEVDLGVLDDRSRVGQRLALSALASEHAAESARPPELARGDMRTVLLERIIKTNELISAAFLIEGARKRRSVGRVVIRGSSGTVLGYGTGWMTSPRLLITNNHVLDSSATASNSTIQFDYVEMLDGRQMTIEEFPLAPSEFFVTDENLDFTLVAVSPRGLLEESLSKRGWTPLIAESGKAIVGERVNIIQHPNGEPQQLALRQNRIIDVVGDFLHYEADTRKGSSGSPVSNDAWQAAALHHAGVPKRDSQNRILLSTGQPWNGDRDTIPLIDWIANEGARISKIVEKIRSLESGFTATQKALFAQVFSRPNEDDSDETINPSREQEARPRYEIDRQGRVVYTVPVQIAIGIPDLVPQQLANGDSVSSAPPAPAATPQPVVSAAPRIDENDLQTALAAAREHESDEYYQEAIDLADIDEYYEGIAEDASLVGRQLFHALNNLLRETHATVFSYKKARLEHLYPWVDLRPDRQLKSIYSGEGFSVEEVIREDLEVAARHESMIAQFMTTESASDPETLEAFLDNLESSSPFNCEHVVPQSWFAKKQPMKADLHHLFTCESDCNSFRGNIPYFEFPPEDEVVRQKCGRRETNDRFEPTAGKGVVARATMYFILRYQGIVGDEARELQSARLPILMKWHTEEPVTIYERHRNAAIRAVQGNRNPLIDFPEWAEHIDFEAGFGN